ncbi:MAG TPA: type II toxin-antitoxin system ParD family antitoxin [Bryobacteraceae bacterium]|nr:type II toxin-antitoxin system ParD family antitoxin [Bryobacteraceae bacterium]
MQTMNISLPDPMKHFVEEQVGMGGYSSASEYVRELVRADQKRKAKEQLETVLLEALKSDPETVTPKVVGQVACGNPQRGKDTPGAGRVAVPVSSSAPRPGGKSKPTAFISKNRLEPRSPTAFLPRCRIASRLLPRCQGWVLRAASGGQLRGACDAGL